MDKDEKALRRSICRHVLVAMESELLCHDDMKARDMWCEYSGGSADELLEWEGPQVMRSCRWAMKHIRRAVAAMRKEIGR